MPSAKPSRLVNLLGKVVITLLAFGLFAALRPDTLDRIQNPVRRFVFSKGVIDDYMEQNKVRKLHLGAGSRNLNGWLNTEIDLRSGQAYLDATKAFPLPDQSFHYVFSEHLIEHLPYDDAMVMIKESYRVLAPGGKVRIHTPDLAKLIALFREPKSEATLKFIREKAEVFRIPANPEMESFILNMQMHEWGHQFLYTPKMLRARLEEAGFTDVKIVGVAESTDSVFHHLSGRLNTQFESTDAQESMAIEATRK